MAEEFACCRIVVGKDLPTMGILPCSADAVLKYFCGSSHTVSLKGILHRVRITFLHNGRKKRSGVGAVFITPASGFFPGGTVPPGKNPEAGVMKTAPTTAFLLLATK